ncbi:putative phosphatidylethanolamine-binding protein [Helianthus anomalus]
MFSIMSKQNRSNNELMPNLITSKPHVDIGGEDMRSAYTHVTFLIIMTDPDVPGPNIPGTTDASFGREIMSYETPKPVIGIHRYVFLLFKQKTRKSVSPPTSRDHFNTRNFSQQHGLGLPVAAVYFNAQRENAARRR